MRACDHGQVVIGRVAVDKVVGVVRKTVSDSVEALGWRLEVIELNGFTL
ncbi:hypothetical protein U8607_22850 [Methylobacterium durans]|nr:hypothetical protein [Methylobacterium durans]MEA1834937.1 hypothetical protein [Methylobacterium durans]